MVEKGIRGGICHSICGYAKANKECMKDHEKNKRILLYSILGCKQLIWMGNVPKTSSE